MYLLRDTEAKPRTRSLIVALLSFAAIFFIVGTSKGLQIAFFFKPSNWISPFGLIQFESGLQAANQSNA